MTTKEHTNTLRARFREAVHQALDAGLTHEEMLQMVRARVEEEQACEKRPHRGER